MNYAARHCSAVIGVQLFGSLRRFKLQKFALGLSTRHVADKRTD